MSKQCVHRHTINTTQIAMAVPLAKPYPPILILGRGRRSLGQQLLLTTLFLSYFTIVIVLIKFFFLPSFILYTRGTKCKRNMDVA